MWGNNCIIFECESFCLFNNSEKNACANNQDTRKHRVNMNYSSRIGTEEVEEDHLNNFELEHANKIIW